MSTVAVVGSRGFPDLAYVRQYVAERIYQNDVLVSGGAVGVDLEAERAHLGRGGAVLTFHADWQGLGRRAGHVRNQQIVQRAERIVAFWDGESPGTKSTIELALRHRKNLEVIFP